MKLSIVVFGSILVGLGLFKAPARQVKSYLIIGGDVLGYLSPCGCTKPMTGGIRRWAEAVKKMDQIHPTTIVINGGFVEGTSRQDEMKAESLAESYANVGVKAINLTKSEVNLGRGLLSSLYRLSKGALISGSFEQGSEIEFKKSVESDFFVMTGIDSRSAQIAGQLSLTEIPQDSAVQSLIDESKQVGKPSILLVAGDVQLAQTLATRFPELDVIVFRASSPLRPNPTKIGKTLLVSPGEHNKDLVSLSWDGEQFSDYRVISLGPEFDNEKDVSRFYDNYLTRVEQEGLLMEMPRVDSEPFAGTEKCVSCHTQEGEVWCKSEHAHALKSLEDDHHGKDPDCVKCHVVGLDSKLGYMDRSKTPQLANVGCESCHGPGQNHSQNPEKSPLQKTGEQACAKCHVKEHSPKFEFNSYWEKIQH